MTNEFTKTSSWSVVVFTMAGLVAYIVTGSVTKALIIGGCELLWEPPCYFIHEKAWALVHRRGANQVRKS